MKSNSLITQQQELVSRILEATNKIDRTVSETVIIVPDILHETKKIRELVLKIFEMEQLVLLDMIFGVNDTDE